MRGSLRLHGWKELGAVLSCFIAQRIDQVIGVWLRPAPVAPSVTDRRRS
jgi:hypothetical protein